MALSRRKWLRQTLGTAAAAPIALHYAKTRANSPNETIRLACVGVGGMGESDIASLASHPSIEIAALCDVDSQNLMAASKKYAGAKIFADFREMFSKHADEFDAVSVSTPDHTHAAAAATAILRGKHVYCQKPLTHDIYEARRLTELAGEHQVVTQMGVQIHSNQEYRSAVATIQSGAIGKVRAVHSWSNKTWGYEGEMPEPTDVPESLAWDLWLGTAPTRPYSKGHYHPGNWRRWCDFGCGTMGDMSIHILDPVFNALQLTSPTRVQSTSQTASTISFGMQNAVKYQIASTEYTTPDFELTWHDGGAMPDTAGWPTKLDDGTDLTLPGQGSMFQGEKGWMLLPHVAMPIVIDGKLSVQQVAGGDHYHLWADAILGDEPTTAGFDYAGPLTEAVLAGVIANRFPNMPLDWDRAGMQFTNSDEATSLVRRDYRAGFEVDGLS